MARPKLSDLVMLLFFFILTNFTSKSTATKPNNFIKLACTATHYQPVCIQTLSPYANKIGTSDRQVAVIALSASNHRARSVTKFISGIRLRQAAVKQCAHTMRIGAGQLSKACFELRATAHGKRRSRGDNFLWHVSNVVSNVSSALTNQQTCLDGLDGLRRVDSRLAGVIRSQTIGVMQLSSNALALVESFAAVRGGA